ncbi:unnamed protein product [Effrenium voratum]|uniref:Uncharacterized protein n=1 Tax=Effrenium voratum TaxID=2562239 RepID=A0AA36J2B1_9DINO|nr:unnamed protein product [Effrenium voratum]
MIARAHLPERYNDRMTTSVVDIGFIRADNIKATDHGITAWHNLSLANHSNALYIALTTEEYISFVGDTTPTSLEKVGYIPGNLRYPSFDFTVLTTNPHDAVMTTPYLMSEDKLTTANTADLYIIAWHCDMTKLLDLTSRPNANTFNRGYMLQQLQIYSNGVWQLSPTEKDSVTAWRFVPRTCFFDIYSKYTWEAGYMHSY